MWSRCFIEIDEHALGKIIFHSLHQYLSKRYWCFCVERPFYSLTIFDEQYYTLYKKRKKQIKRGAFMKKIKVIFTLATSLLLLQGCNNTPSKANENTNSTTELQTVQKEKDSLEKTNKELTKKLTDLESKAGKEQKTYELDKKLAQKIYSIYTGSPWGQ